MRSACFGLAASRRTRLSSDRGRTAIELIRSRLIRPPVPNCVSRPRWDRNPIRLLKLPDGPFGLKNRSQSTIHRLRNGIAPRIGFRILVQHPADLELAPVFFVENVAPSYHGVRGAKNPWVNSTGARHSVLDRGWGLLMMLIESELYAAWTAGSSSFSSRSCRTRCR